MNKHLIFTMLAAAFCSVASAQAPLTKAKGASVTINAPQRADSKLDAFYMPPLCRLFYGFEKFQTEFSGMPIEVYPASQKLYWENLSDNSSATYAWKYFDVASDQETTTSDDEDTLTLEYDLESVSNVHVLDGMSACGALLPAPTIIAEDGDESASYASCKVMQIGGAPLAKGSLDPNDTWHNLGLLPFSPEEDGIMNYIVDGVPVFGYSPNSTQWLTNLTFNGHPDPNEFAYCNGVYNVIIPAETPLTIRGARFYGRGKLNPDAEFTFELLPSTEDGEFIFTPLSQATCAVKDMGVTPDGDMNIYEMTFTLPEPVAISELDCPYFLVGIRGFYEAGEFFAPYQSRKPNPYELALGYYRCTVSYSGAVADDWMWHVANFINEDDEDLYSTFAIVLDASYPWVDDTWQGAELPAIDAPAAEAAYDLMGRPVSPAHRGLTITPGRKRLQF